MFLPWVLWWWFQVFDFPNTKNFNRFFDKGETLKALSLLLWSFFPLLLQLFFETYFFHVAQRMETRMTLTFWFSSPYLLSSGFIGIHHHIHHLDMLLPQHRALHLLGQHTISKLRPCPKYFFNILLWQRSTLTARNACIYFLFSQVCTQKCWDKLLTRKCSWCVKDLRKNHLQSSPE